MPLYEPTGLQGTIGKDIPAMGPFKGMQIKLQGPGSGKIKLAIAIAQYGWRFVKKHPRIVGFASGTAIASGLKVGSDAPSSKYRKALRSVQSVHYRQWSARHKRTAKCCCCAQCK